MANSFILEPLRPAVAPYQHQDFPTMLHHPDGRYTTVHTAKAKLRAEASGYGSTPHFPRHFEHISGQKKIVRNIKEQDELLKGPDREYWHLHECSELMGGTEPLVASKPAVFDVEDFNEDDDEPEPEVRRGRGRPRKDS